MSLFQEGQFKLHSGELSTFKVDCDALTDDDWHCMAIEVAARFSFSEVEGVPTGGSRFAKALESYVRSSGGLLIVDDVLTTGASMEEQRAGRDAVGVVVFSRGIAPSWVHPIWSLTLPF